MNQYLYLKSFAAIACASFLLGCTSPHVQQYANEKADDVVGEAQGDLAGNALNWTYTLALPVDGTIYHVQFNDWMYLITPKVMLNKAKMSKFGIELGEVTLSFYKR